MNQEQQDSIEQTNSLSESQDVDVSLVKPVLQFSSDSEEGEFTIPVEPLANAPKYNCGRDLVAGGRNEGIRLYRELSCSGGNNEKSRKFPKHGGSTKKPKYSPD